MKTFIITLSDGQKQTVVRLKSDSAIYAIKKVLTSEKGKNILKLKTT